MDLQSQQGAVRAIEQVEAMRLRAHLKRSRSQMGTLGFTPSQMEKGENEVFGLHFDSNGRRRIIRVDGKEPILGIQPTVESTGALSIVASGGGFLYRLAADGQASLTFGGPGSMLGRSGAITRINIGPINAEGGPYVPGSTPLRLGFSQAKRANNAAQLLPDKILAAGNIAQFIRLVFAGNDSQGVEDDDVLGVVDTENAYILQLVNFAATPFDFTCHASMV